MGKKSAPTEIRSLEEITTDFFGIVPVEDRPRAIDLLTEFSFALAAQLASTDTTMSPVPEE